MTREEAKRRAELYSALADGKTIQWKHPTKGEWLYINIGEFNSFCETIKYRIKPEQKYRPFNSKEECWNEMMKHQPFGWLKSKKDGRFCCIGEVPWSDEFETVCIALSTSLSLSRSADSVFEKYTFADGTAFGIKEE